MSTIKWVESWLQGDCSPTRYIMKSDLKYFVNQAHAWLEDDECDLESWVYRLESLCWLEDAEEIRTDKCDILNAAVDQVI